MIVMLRTKQSNEPRVLLARVAIEALMRSPTTETDIVEITKALEWQPHTVRGAIAGALKKKLGLNVESEKVDDRGRVYRIAE